MTRPPCVIADCDRPQKGRGWCAKHYQRWFRSGGDPTVPRISVPAPGDPVGYYPAHQRVKNLRGAAKQYQCGKCDGQAKHWAYDNADPDEVRDSEGRRYSLDPNHYLPLCTYCHAAFDAEYRQQNGITTRIRRGRRAKCGTRAAYQRWKCRCDPCRAAQAAYRAARPQKPRERKPLTREQRDRVNELQNARRRRLTLGGTS